VQRLLLESVDSTNAEGLRRAAALDAPLWILAGEQTAARGRRMRPWTSPRGNFHGSLVRRIHEPPGRLALRSFVAALALHDAFRALGVAESRLALKWPNDVLLDGAKISGILLEAAGDVLAIGIGINLVAAPPVRALEKGALPGIALLEATGLRPGSEGMLDRLAPAMERHEERLCREGFAPVRAAFLERAARLGQKIRVRTGGPDREGIFESIDPDGNLLLRCADGSVEAIAAADVFF